MDSVKNPIKTYLLTLVSMALVLSSFSACDLPPSFGAEYKVSTTNFISASPLSTPPLATDLGTTVAVDVLAQWDWAWRAQTGNTYDYLTMVDQGVGTGPDGNGNAWLLEAVNLADNPTFGGGLTTGWTALGVTSMDANGTIHGKSLKVESGDNTKCVYVDRTLFVYDLAASPAHNYTLSMNATGTVGLKYIETGAFPYSVTNLQIPGWSGSGPYSLTLTGITTTSTQALAFTNPDLTFELDDVTAIRTDVVPTKWAMVLRLSPNDTTPSLVPGIYEFSVYVKQPSAYAFSTDSTRGDNPNYASRFVTLRMTQTIGTLTQTVAVESFDIAALASPSTWNRLVLRMPAGSNFSFDETTATQVIELSISPMNPSAPEAGAILVSTPSLNYYINGY